MLLGVDTILHLRVLHTLGHERLCVHHSRAPAATVWRLAHLTLTLELRRHVRTSSLLVRRLTVVLRWRVGDKALAAHVSATTTAVWWCETTLHAGVAHIAVCRL